MENSRHNYQKVKKKYLNFLSSQQVMSEPFRNKLGQLNKFYLPLSKMIKQEYVKQKKTKIIGLTGGQGTGKSTISNILKIILKEAYNLETIIFSIDDFYKTLNERKFMSKTTAAKRPLTTLQKNVKKTVIVRLKNEVEYKGKMKNVDSYMNLIMTEAEELVDGKTVGKFARAILRGNNVLFIKLEDEI